MFIDQKGALLIWDVILVMTAISTIIFVALIIVRIFSDKRKALKKARISWMRRKILFHLENPLKNIEKEILQKKGDTDILMEVSYDLLRNVRGSSHEKILKLLTDSGFDKYVLKKLKSEKETSLLLAASLCHYWPNKEVKERLVELFDHKNIAVKYAVSEAVSNLGDLSLIPVLVKKVEEEKRFSPLMICMLFKNFGPDCEKKMVAVLKNSKSLRVRKAVLMVLARFHNENNAKIISKFCKHKDPEIRILAFLALSSIKEPVSLEILEYGAKDSSIRVRKYTARSAKYSFPDSSKVLSKLLGDDNWLVGLEAAKSLITSGHLGEQILGVLSRGENITGQRAKMILLEGGKNAVS